VDSPTQPRFPGFGRRDGRRGQLSCIPLVHGHRLLRDRRGQPSVRGSVRSDAVRLEVDGRLIAKALKAFDLYGISCPTTTSCEAVGQWREPGKQGPLALVWSNDRWSLQATSVSGGNIASFGGVSCVSAVWCVAVGYRWVGSFNTTADAAVWNGAKWVDSNIAATPNSSSLVDVSCTSATFCLSGGANSYGFSPSSYPLVGKWNGSAWTLVATSNIGGEKSGARVGSAHRPRFDWEEEPITSVSCVTPTFCQLTQGNNSDYNAIVSWDGSALSYDSGTQSYYVMVSVACRTSDFCVP
jgi:hypothetical protein